MQWWSVDEHQEWIHLLFQLERMFDSAYIDTHIFFYLIYLRMMATMAHSFTNVSSVYLSPQHIEHRDPKAPPEDNGCCKVIHLYTRGRYTCCLDLVLCLFMPSCVLLNLCNSSFFLLSQTAFRFPLKLAISGVVSFITLYQVLVISIRLYNANRNHSIIQTKW